MLQWAKSVISAISSPLSSSNNVLLGDLDLLRQVCLVYYDSSSPSTADPRLPRLILYHLGYLASSICLLEQAIWSNMNTDEQINHAVDAYVYASWVKSMGARGVARDLSSMLTASALERKLERQLDQEMVYGKDRSRLARM